MEISVAENDSIDGSDLWLKTKSVLWRKNSDFHLSTLKLHTTKYPSVWNIARIRNLAAARQRCLDQVPGGLQRFTKIAYIEPDVTYDPSWCSELVFANHPRAAGLPEPDIYSGWSLRSERHPKESTFLYDTCATRATSQDTCWDVQEKWGTWRGNSLVRTPLEGVHANALHTVWSTFNCFCVYNAEPFASGRVKWGYLNKRLNPSGIPVDGFFLDADTVVVCEDFRTAGYDGVYLNTNCLVRHA